MAASKILSDIYERAHHADYIGEKVTQLQHALQAAELASQTDDDELILAALLHDVGHLCFPDAPKMADVGVAGHEGLGADFLTSLGFSQRVAELVEGHVAAKRYLVTTRPSYSEKLSEASQTTLQHQGGPMTASEVAAFEQHEDYAALLKLRAWDEAAKTNVETHDFSFYVPMIDRHIDQQKLNLEQIEQFHTQGYLHIQNYFTARQVERLQKSVAELEDLPETPGKWMKYFEQGEDHERLLCRIENFLDYDATLNALTNGPLLNTWLSQLMAEPAVLFKEKINFKLPGANGFEPHQDAPAFTSFNQNYHITLMLSFDASDEQNGCLEVAPGDWGTETLPMEADKTISRAFAKNLNWKPVETAPGDILMFGSYIPHRSLSNSSSRSRRALYATYNRLAEGEVRSKYFAEKRKVFPPDVERIVGHDYSDAGVFNVGNPVAAN